MSQLAHFPITGGGGTSTNTNTNTNANNRIAHSRSDVDSVEEDSSDEEGDENSLSDSSSRSSYLAGADRHHQEAINPTDQRNESISSSDDGSDHESRDHFEMNQFIDDDVPASHTANEPQVTSKGTTRDATIITDLDNFANRFNSASVAGLEELNRDVSKASIGSDWSAPSVISNMSDASSHEELELDDQFAAMKSAFFNRIQLPNAGNTETRSSEPTSIRK